MSRKVIIRMDDICPQMKRAPFYRMKDLLDRYNAKAIIGVVPDCKDQSLNLEDEDPEFWHMIKELQNNGWTIAMHGCYHVYVTKENGYISDNKRSEFAGLSYQQQLEKIQYGKEKLREEGIITDVFMAPSHSYDKNTLLALKAAGFRYITDGLTSKPYEHMGLVFIPCIEPKIINANRLMTVCYHTNMIAESRYKETEELLKAHRDEVISFSDAYDLPRVPYMIARVEEYLRWIWKYRVKASLYRLWVKMKG